MESHLLGKSLLFMLLFLLSSKLCCASLPEFSIAEGVTVAQPDQRLQEAFKDALILARVTAATFDTCDGVFLRYFRTLEATFVQDVFRTIANFPVEEQIDDQTIIEIISSASVVSELQPKLAKLEIALGNHPALPEDRNLCGTQSAGGTVFAFTYADPSALGDVALISLCEQTFQYPSLQEIENPPSTVRDAEGNPLLGYTCDGLGDHDSDWMSSPGGVLLHELMHWIYLLEDIPNYYDLIEENELGDHQIGDFNGPNPPDGSGPLNTRLVKNLGVYQAIQNAENYRWYAQSKYWSWKCRKSFGESTDEQDDARRLGVRASLAPPESGE